jgi:hypothetical protein
VERNEAPSPDETIRRQEATSIALPASRQAAMPPSSAVAR